MHSLHSLPSSQYQNCSKKLGLLMKPCFLSQDIILILKHMKVREENLNSINFIVSLLPLDNRTAENIIQISHRILQLDRMAKALPSIYVNEWLYHATYILNKLPKENVMDFLQNIESKLKKVDMGQEFPSSPLKKVDESCEEKSERDNFCNALTSKFIIYRNLLLIPEPQQEGIKDLLINFKSPTIYNALRSLGSEERVNFIKFIKLLGEPHFSSSLNSSSDKYEIFNDSEKKNLLEKVIIYLARLTKGSRSYCLKETAAILPHMEWLATLLNFDRVDFFDVLILNPIPQRKVIVRKLIDFLEKRHEDLQAFLLMDRMKKLKIIEFIFIPLIVKEICYKIKPYVLQKIIKYPYLKVVKKFIYSLPTLFCVIQDLLDGAIQFKFLELIFRFSKALCSKKTPIKFTFNSLKEFIFNVFDIKPSLELAEFVIEYYHELRIFENDSLFKRAIQVAAKSKPLWKKERRFPIRLYIELKYRIKQESLIETSFISTKPFEKAKMFNFTAYRNRRLQHQYKAKDLPAFLGMEKTIIELTAICCSIRKKLFKLTRAQQEEYLSSLTLSKISLEAFNNSMIRNWLNLNTLEDKNVPIESTAYYFNIILDAILKASPTKNKDFFSTQEEMLLGLIILMKGCPSGIRDGISRYYQLLPSYHKIKCKFSLSEWVKTFVDLCVENVFEKVLADSALWHSLVPEFNPVVYKLHHSNQILYLKNRLCKQLGLNHSLTFDHSTQCILNKLIDTPTKELVNKICKQISENLLIRQIKINCEDLFNHPELYSHLFNFFETQERDIDKKADWRSNYFVTNKKNQICGITDVGATSLLAYSGCLIYPFKKTK